MADSESQKQPGPGEIGASIPQADLFGREAPAILNGPKGSWEAARAVIDFGGALIVAGSQVRDKRQIRHAVLAAILRRATITAEACYNLLAMGLLEPAIVQGRTLLDLELAAKLIHQDRTDEMAKRLAAYHYYTYQSHGQDVLSDRPSREGVLETDQHIRGMVDVTKSYARLLETSVFDDVREDVRASRYWHGFDSAEEAFRAIDQSSDYFMTYDSYTWFVHAVNVEHDYASTETEPLRLRALAERDPKRIQIPLANAILHFLEILRVYIDEIGLPAVPEFAEKSSVRLPDGSTVDVDVFQALRTVVLATF